MGQPVAVVACLVTALVALLTPARAAAQAPVAPAAPVVIEAPAPWRAAVSLAPVRITAVPPPPGGARDPLATLRGAIDASAVPDRLRAVLRYHAGIERTGRLLGGAIIAGTGVVSAVGAVLTLTNPALRGTLAGDIFGWSLVAVAPVYVLLGAVTAFIPGTYERFSADYARDLATARTPGDAALRMLIRWQAEAERQRGAQRTTAVTGFIGGAIALGYGGVLLATPPLLNPAFSAGLGTVFLLLGAVEVGAAVGALVFDPPAEQLLRTFRLAAGLERVPPIVPRTPPPSPLRRPPRMSLTPLPGGLHVALGWRL